MFRYVSLKDVLNARVSMSTSKPNRVTGWELCNGTLVVSRANNHTFVTMGRARSKLTHLQCGFCLSRRRRPGIDPLLQLLTTEQYEKNLSTDFRTVTGLPTCIPETKTKRGCKVMHAKRFILTFISNVY